MRIDLFDKSQYPDEVLECFAEIINLGQQVPRKQAYRYEDGTIEVHGIYTMEEIISIYTLSTIFNENRGSTL